MTRKEILDTLSEIICDCDDIGEYGIADKVFEVLTQVKLSWGMNPEEE